MTWFVGRSSKCSVRHLNQTEAGQGQVVAVIGEAGVGQSRLFYEYIHALHTHRCLVLENTDSVRHALMLPGLNPMFTPEFRGPGIQSARFVTPDQDITLDFHCHVETHEKMGMHGQLIVGKGEASKSKRKLKQISFTKVSV